MDPVTNPYSPGAGRPPAALVGREAQLSAWATAIARVHAGRDAQSITLYGLRGVGKTVLLSRFSRMARDLDWVVAQIEAKPGNSMRDLIGEALRDELIELARPGLGRRVLTALKTYLSFKASYDTNGTWSFGLDLKDAEGGGADSGAFEPDLGKLLKDLSGAAEERGVGVALLIDEAQDLPNEELVALCSILHGATQRQERLVVALAGLPSLPRKLAEAKSYAERQFSFHVIDALAEADAADALINPALDEGAQWDPDAVDHVVARAGGYPYFLQQYGQEVWNVAEGSTITRADARQGVEIGQLALDSGFFRIRWDRATPAEKDYLKAMAVDGDAGSLTGAVADRLHKKITAIGPTRANLINKGLVYSPDHGIVAYTVPAMAAFVRRQPV